MADASPYDPSKAHFAPEPLAHDRQLIRARYSSDGSLLAAVGVDKLIHVWESATRRHYTLPGHATWVSALVFHPKTPRLFTGDFHGAVHAWDATKEGAPPLFTIAADRDNTRALAVTPDGAHLLSGGDDAIVRIWNADSGAPMREMPGHAGPVFSVAAHPDGKHAVSGDLFGRVIQWELGSGKVVREFDAKALHTRKEDFIADVGGVRCMTFSPDGTLLACGGFSNAESNAFCPGTPLVLVFDNATGAKKTELRYGFKSDGPVNGLRFLQDGTLAGWGEHQNGPTQLVFWKLDAPEPFHKVAANSAYDLDLHPDGTRLLAPVFKALGPGGNGALRKELREKYVAPGAQLLVCNLFAAPAVQK